MASKNFTPKGDLIQQDNLEDNNMEQSPNESQGGRYDGETPEQQQQREREEQEDTETPQHRPDPRDRLDDAYYTPNDLISLGDETPDNSVAWRWDLRRV